MTEAAAPAGAARATSSIAVVGVACRFPDADDPAELLDTVLTGRRAFRRLPAARFSLADYYRSDPATSDATYSTRAALLAGWRFDCAAFGVRPAVYLASDPAHWLALETAARALAAAGLPAGAGLDRDRTGVIIGNTLAGDTSRANALRVRWPYVRRALTDALSTAGLQRDQADGVLRRTERRYLTPFPAIGPHTLAGSMPATIASAISAYFGFRGGSHAVDSACSSSLQAVASACATLAAGDLDAVIAGGVDLSLDPLELIGLAKAGLLATTDVRVYDQNPSGYLPGEGCGVLILMRAADARAAGLPVNAEIIGWGTSSGGMPGQPRSQASSQLLALRRAYDRAGVDPADIGYIEGNGAATLTDDDAELRALASIRAGARRPAALGSVKANIGHTGAAAGAAGLIKTVLTVSAGVIPPTTGADRPHDLIASGHAGLMLSRAARDWDASRRFAAVSATGIAGSNVHLVLRNEGAGKSRSTRWIRPVTSEPDPDGVQPRLAAAAEPLIFLLHAPDRDALAVTLSRLADTADLLSDAELLDLACSLGRDQAQQGPARAALLAARQEQLAAQARAAAWVLPDLADGLIGVRPGVFASDHADGRVTLLLSGDQPAAGGQAAADALVDGVRHCLDMLRWLDSLDVAATGAVGHGLGLLAGLAWAGVLGEVEVVEIAELRAQFMVRAVARGADPAEIDAEPGAWPPPDDADAAALRAAIAQRFRFGPPRRRLISTVTGAEIGSVNDAIDLVCRGFSGADRTAAAVAAGAIGATLLLDTGPGLTLAEAATAARVPTLSLRSGFADQVNIARVAAALFASGALGNAQPLFAGWQTRPIDIWRDKQFIASPCEVVPGPRSSEGAAVRAAGGEVTAPMAEAGFGSRSGAATATRAVAATERAQDAAPTSRPDGNGARASGDVAAAARPGVPYAAVLEPARVAEPAEVAEPAGPAEPADLPEQASPAEPADLPEPASPTEPADLPEPASPTEPADLPEQASPTEPASLHEPASPAEPADLLQPASLPEPASHLASPVAGLAAWTRCFAETLRPAQRPTAPLPSRAWRVYAAARSPWLADLGGQFTADPSARRTLAVIEDPADERSLTTALAAARDAVSTGELLVLTTGPGFTGFFATLRAEHPAVGVTVLRVPPEAASAAAIASFAGASPGQFRELVIGKDGAASEPVVTELPVPGGGGFPLDGDDVIVVSRSAGGAGLALARVLACAGTGIAVIGRAGEHDDTEFIAGLEQLRSAGARIGYEVIDVRDPASLASAISRIGARLGPVTAIAHAATPDDPVPILDLTDRDVVGRLADQVSTLERVAGSLPAGQLKLVISIGTVAGRYGLAGAGLDTLSRGALVSTAAEIAAARIGCRTLHVDMAAWAEHGLGQQPGLRSRLAAADAPAISLGAASRLLLKVMTTPGLPSSVAVHGRVGGLASTRAPVLTSTELAAAGLPHDGRFLREVAVHYPGIELVCSARLSLASDPYLTDYRIDGMPVLPPVLALEALAEAASVLAGRPVRQATAVRFDAPVLIPAAGDVALRLCAQRHGDSIDAVLRSPDSSYLVDHATAVFSCEPPDLPQSPVAAAASAGSQLTAPGAGLIDGSELYGPVCFQSGRFRRIAALPEVTARSGRAIARGADDQPWFAPGSDLAGTGWLLGSPALNDAALQVLQACVPDRRVRPAGCESVQFAGRDVTGPVEFRAIAEPVRAPRAVNGVAAAAALALAAVPGQPAAPTAERDVAAGAGPGDTTSSAAATGTVRPSRTGPAAVAATGPQPRKSRHARKARGLRGWQRAGTATAAVETYTEPGTGESDGEPARVRPAAAGIAGGTSVARPVGWAGRADSRQLWSVEAVDADGRLVAAWRGVRLRDAGPLPRTAAWPPALLSVFLERSATALGLDPDVRVTVSRGQADDRLAGIQRQSRPLAGRAAGGGSPAAGRHAGPERRGLHTVSLAGAGPLAGFTLTLRAPVPVACGWVTVDEASRQHKPSAGLAIAYAQLRAELGEEPPLLAARLEAVRTCVTAAGLPADADLRVTHATSDGWALLAIGRARIATAVTEISGVSEPVAVALLTMRRAHARAPAARSPAAVTR